MKTQVLNPFALLAVAATAMSKAVEVAVQSVMPQAQTEGPGQMSMIAGSVGNDQIERRNEATIAELTGNNADFSSLRRDGLMAEEDATCAMVSGSAVLKATAGGQNGAMTTARMKSDGTLGAGGVHGRLDGQARQ